VLLIFLWRQSFPDVGDAVKSVLTITRNTHVGLAFRAGGSDNVEAWILRDRLLD
jgi:hypothetical protein